MTNIKKRDELGYIYEKVQDPLIRKSIGQYYTPSYIIEYILKKTLNNINIVEDPYIKVIDPSCGAGYFLLEVYDILKNKFFINIDKLKIKYKYDTYILEEDGNKKKVLGEEYWKKENIHYHLLKNCIYGVDKDDFAVELTIKGLIKKEAKSIVKDLNILKCDSLVKWESKYNWQELKEELKRLDNGESIKEFDLTYRDNSKKTRKEKISEKRARDFVSLGEFWSNKFQICVGNPPYIGHKQMDKEYKKWLLKEYAEVFKDKADISFCFFNRIVDVLSPNGLCGLITSRYFMESPTGEKLRAYLKNNVKIIEILDFYGANIFEGVGIATAIYFFEKKNMINNKINVTKLCDDSYKFNDDIDLEKIIKTKVFENFTINQKDLQNDRWILISDEFHKIYEKIRKKTKVKLGDIVNSYQGIITGCDKAFILTLEEINENKIEKDVLKKWIKSKDIEKFDILKDDLYLIYSNLIDTPIEYPNAINFIKEYSLRLENRRECKNGIRRWYELQWGRKVDLFEQDKIIFPYKSKTNRFAIDYDNLYFSADIYGFIIKNEYKENISLEYLVGLLNSNVYEFYFKLFAKKMGRGIYDYYPNSLLDLNIITDTIIVKIIDRVNKIMKLINNEFHNNIEIKEKISTLQEEIDNIIMDYLNCNKKEKSIIKNI